MASNRYKYKENCLEDCQQLISNSLYDDVEECIQDLQDTYGPKSCLESKPKVDCPILEKPEFKKLIQIFNIFLKFIYSVRFQLNKQKKASNMYDQILISNLVSNVDLKKLGIRFEDLECVKFSHHSGYPQTLARYIFFMAAVMHQNNNSMANFKNFKNDFQPWTKTLVNFVNLYNKKMGLVELPDVSRVSSYKSSEFFDEKLSERLYKFLLKNDVSSPSLGKKLLQFMKPTRGHKKYMKKRRKRAKNKKKTRRKKKRK